MTDRFAFPELKNNRAKGVRAGTLWIVKDGGGDVTLSLNFDALNSFEKGNSEGVHWPSGS